MIKKPSEEYARNIRPALHFIDWTPEMLHDERLNLNLTQKEVANVMGVTGPAVSSLERGVSNNPWAIQCYGLILERYRAYIEGYVPAYRKIGTNQYKAD